MSERRDWWLEHTIINLLCWGVLIDIPLIAARNFKLHRYYLIFHGIFSTLIILASLLAESAMSYTSYMNYHTEIFINMTPKPTSQFHLVFGVSVFVLITFQLFGGWIAYSIIMGKTIKNILIIIKQTHKYVGYLIYVLAKINVILGAILSWKGYDIWTQTQIIMYSVYTFLITWRMIIEVMYQRNSTIFLLECLGKKQYNREEIQISLMSINRSDYEDTINNNNDLSKQQENQMTQNKQIIFFNNLIIDISEFVHPGGQFIFQAVLGRDVSRYIYGVCGLEDSDLAPYKHSQYAIQMLKRNTIGTLPQIPLFSTSQLEGENIWTISKSQQLNDLVSIFYFNKSNVKFQTYLEGIQDCGRYFMLSSFSDKKISTRPYTMVICMAECNQIFRTEILNYLSKHLGIKLYVQTELQNNRKDFGYEEYSEGFPLIIKKYPSSTGFSQHIHNSSLDQTNPSQFLLNGPFGTSIGINQSKIQKIVLIAAGTGLFPFLDLLNFLLMKTIYDILKMKYGLEIANLVNPQKINFDDSFKVGSKVILILSVKDQKELIAHDIYLNLLKLQDQLQHKNFELILSLSQGPYVQGVECVQRARFDRDFLSKYIKNIESVDRFLICGPQIINKSVPNTLRQMGIERNAIRII